MKDDINLNLYKIFYEVAQSGSVSTASICAGSSLFMWSATAGFILSKKVNQASLTDKNDKKLVWNIANYLKYGLITYFL